MFFCVSVCARQHHQVERTVITQRPPQSQLVGARDVFIYEAVYVVVVLAFILKGIGIFYRYILFVFHRIRANTPR